MLVITQNEGSRTEVSADSWCVDWLLERGCAAVDGPLTEVMAACEEVVVVAVPETFIPHPGDPLAQFPAEDGDSWPVATGEGTVVVQAEGSGRWSEASWTFELTRDEEGC